ncbi:MAG: hypothetical protein R2719_06505 [Micropruina sp.]
MALVVDADALRRLPSGPLGERVLLTPPASWPGGCWKRAVPR